jgi:hypothetical protein
VDSGNSRTDTAGNTAGRDLVLPEELDRELEKILASQTFAKSRRLRDLLRYTVERIKTGHTDSVKEYLLAVEVFNRKPSFDPRFDSIVRVQASRLEQRNRTRVTRPENEPACVKISKGFFGYGQNLTEVLAPAW